MNIDSDDLTQLINKEIEWTENNRDSTVPTFYIDGFIDGMTHSKYFIRRLEELVYQGELND